jgi:hypothetical protein
VLSDHERKTLGEVERQCMADDPDFTRAFEAGQTRLSRHPHQLGASLAVVAAALLTFSCWSPGRWRAQWRSRSRPD